MKRLATNMGWLLGGRGFNAVLSLVYLALATRTLGLAGFGHFALILAIGQTVTGLASFQTWQFVVRWGAGTQGAAKATGFAIALDGVSLVLGLILAAGLVWTAPIWLPLPPELLWTAFGYCFVSLLALRSTPTGLLRLRFAYGQAAAADAVQPIIKALGAFLAVLYEPTVTGFIIAWAASEAAVALAMWIAAARHERIDLSRISLRQIPAENRDAWSFVWSTNMMGSLNIGSRQVLTLLVGAIGGEAFAGAFRVASQLGQALMQLAQTMSNAVYPELVHAQDQAVAMARRVAIVALLGGALAVLIALLFGRQALAIIAGPEFRGVYWPMIILAIAGAIELVGASLQSLLVSAGRAGTAFFVRAIPLALAFACLAPAMNWQGVKGAAITVLGSSALAVFGFWAAILSLQAIRITVAPPPEADRSP